MFRCIDGVLDLCFLVGFYLSTGRHTDVKDPGFQTRVLRSWTQILASMSVMINRRWCQIILSAAERWRSQLYYEFSKRWVFILVTLSGSSSPQPRIRFTPHRASHPASWFPLHLFVASLPFPIPPPRSPNNLDLGWAFIHKSRFHSTAASLMAFLNCVPSQNNESQTHLFGFVHSFQNGNVQALQRWQHVEILSQVLGEIVCKENKLLMSNSKPLKV